MNLKVLLPFQVFAEKTGVLRIVAETREGSFGLLPHRLDCVAALAPGIPLHHFAGEVKWEADCKATTSSLDSHHGTMTHPTS